MDDARRQLSAEMNAARLRLGIKWTDVAMRARMSVQNLLRIRKGEIAVTEDAAYGLERALDWRHGSIEAILAGGEPTLDEPELEPVDPAIQALLDDAYDRARQQGRTHKQAMERMRAEIARLDEERQRSRHRHNQSDAG